jgi:V8-like Glu-specific endopeptidase
MFVLSAMVLLASPAVYARGRGNPTGAPGGRFATEHPRRNQVNKRVDNQRGRINEGVKNGELSKKNGELSKGQARQLRANDRAIKAQEHAEVKANGGHLTKAEQRQLNQEENANSKLIHDEKHPAGK